MNNMTEKIESNRSFWQLVEKYEVTIPQLQRDYAQGRPDDNITQIREALISEFYGALYSSKELVLNFVYGEQKNGIFIPIDGQQRLTSLFLLHWYIFKRSGYEEGIEVLKRNFSYKTRVTSERFCKRICEVEIDYFQDSIANQIKDCFWFSGNFKSDPTIQSMIVVIDCIHNYFGEVSDFTILKDKLISDTCPIIFLWLSMDDFNNTDDLYIKMNARGKLLSDFEIFKAKLQNSQYMEVLLGDNCTEKDRIFYISKYNNQFAELFYKYHGDNYDIAMMSFVMTTIRDEYFSYASEYGVSQKEYRDIYKSIAEMNGSTFFRFVEQEGVGYSKIQNPRSIIASALEKADRLLDIFVNQVSLTIPTTITKIYYDETEVFKMDFLKLTFEQTVVKHALYDYIYKFGFPNTKNQKESYNHWKRYVYNVISNTNLGGRPEDACDAMVMFRNVLTEISNESYIDVLCAIKDFTDSTAETKYQQSEERIKAELMLKDAEWYNLILLAEEYFIDGQIGFLLEFSKESNDEYDKQLFKKNLQVSKKIFTGKKSLIKDITFERFERALLCMPDYSGNNTAHLMKQSNSITTWGFYKGDYNKLLSNRDGGKKRRSIGDLLLKLINVKDIVLELDKIISQATSEQYLGRDAWKYPFIKDDLFNISLGRYYFYNCVHLAQDNTEVLMLAGTTVRSFSMELNTLLLAEKLRQNGISEPKMQLHMEFTGNIMDVTNHFPLRYIEYKGTKTGYINDPNSNDNYIHEDKIGQISRMSFDKVYDLLKNM